MSYLVLARKWRPQNFDEVVGQQPVVKTLRNALRRQRVAHAMIFSGVRGVGKTTLARIMAKALNCAGEGDPPCNLCDSCRGITAGSAVDLHEIDGASNRGIQEIRELKENIRFMPVSGRYKIIIIDEVHMLTAEAFNALLKTLEEPPEHVFFMFATTEPHKIPVTILSRCQRYELKRIAAADLAAFFRKIAAAEGITISDRALDMIVREAEGSVRDGLSLLDQIFSFGGEEVTDQDVTQVLGLVDREVFADLAVALLASDLSASLEILDRTYGAGIDLKRFTNDLLAFFRALLLCKTMNNWRDILDLSDREEATVSEIAAAHSAETLYLHMHSLLSGVEEMQHSSQPRMVLEMAFIKAAQAGQVVPVAALLERLDALARGGVAPVVPETPPISVTVAEPRPEFKNVSASARPAATFTFAEEPSPLDADNPADAFVAGPSPVTAEVLPGEVSTPAPEAQTAPAVNKTAAKPTSETAKKQAAPSAGREVAGNWEAFVDHVKKSKAWMAHVLSLCAAARQEGSKLVLEFDDADDCKMLQDADHCALLNDMVGDYFQSGLRVEFHAAASEQNEDKAADRRVRRELASHPKVQMTTEILGGQVVNIRPGSSGRKSL